MHSVLSWPARANIHARYRLENAFFAAWLDRSMTYSAGCFDQQGERSLEEAQLAKYEMVLRALKLEPDHTLLDVGCGWGGFALHAVSRSRCRVHAICISKRQVDWAHERVRAAGLQERIIVERRDYRKLRGQYDRVVSMEAYEATGQRSWPAYFHAIARCLKPGGAAFLQAAVLDDSTPCRSSTDHFLRRNIHADAALASRRALHDELQRAGLQIVDACNAAGDAARTLRCWRERFAQARAMLGLDDRFCRLWNFYLAYCEAGYRSGRTGLLRALLRHAA
jgi:cyclopropane-fatty-acyl-phospholipid synthase